MPTVDERPFHDAHSGNAMMPLRPMAVAVRKTYSRRMNDRVSRILRPLAHLSPPVDEDEVPVVTRMWCTSVMILLSAFMCLVQTSYSAQHHISNPHNAMFVWMSASTVLALVFPFMLLLRSQHPEPVFWASCAIVLVFPYDPMLMLMSLTSLVARRADTTRTIRAVSASTVIGGWAQLRDVLQPADSSVWQSAIFAKPHTGVDGEPLIVLAGRPTIAATALIVEIIAIAVATIIGLYIRSRASLIRADARAQAISRHAESLEHNLSNQRLADAIAAEAHDTLAHSLSLIALNASALQTEAKALASSVGHTDTEFLNESSNAQPNVDGAYSTHIADLAVKADEIRRQAAGALDEAHTIIGMLRHPQRAWEQLQPDDYTSLTRESLDELCLDARSAGAQLNTWIDVQQLSSLDENIGKVAYRAIQEGLTNARRHAQGHPVSLEVHAAPDHGVHVHVSNPVQSMAFTPGNGLVGLETRTKSVKGACRFGVDERRIFHLDVRLPWRLRDPTPATGNVQLNP